MSLDEVSLFVPHPFARKEQGDKLLVVRQVWVGMDCFTTSIRELYSAFCVACHRYVLFVYGSYSLHEVLRCVLMS